jgi:hypothetical protein
MVVSDNTNTIKTTFGFNFIFQQAFKQHDYTNKSKQKEALNLNGFSLIKCKLKLFEKKLVINKT